MQKRTRLGECYFDLKVKKKKKNEGWKNKRTNEGNERNAKKKSKIVNCQI